MLRRRAIMVSRLAALDEDPAQIKVTAK